MKLNFLSAAGDGCNNFRTFVCSKEINTVEELIAIAKEFENPLIVLIDSQNENDVLIYDCCIE